MPSNVRVSTARLRHLYEVERMSTPQIGMAVGLSDSIVYYRLRKAGVPIRKRGTDLAARRRAKQPLLNAANVNLLYTRDGLSLCEVAEALRVSRSALRRFMVKRCIPRRRQSYVASADFATRYEFVVNEEELVSDYAVRGLTMEMAARKHGISRKSARRILVKHNVPIRNRHSKRPTFDSRVRSNKAAKAA